MATLSWLSQGGLSESFSEASKRLSAAVAPLHLHELSVDGMFPAEGGRPAPLPPATPAAADSGVFTISNADSPTPPTHAVAPAGALPEGSRSARPEGNRIAGPSLAELRAAELLASSLQSEVDATKLKALTKIRAQDEQLRRLRAALDGAEAQRRRLEAEVQRHKLESANAVAAIASASASASTSSGALPASSSTFSAAGFAPASVTMTSESGRQMQPPPTPLAPTHPNAAAAGMLTPLTRTDGGAAWSNAPSRQRQSGPPTAQGAFAPAHRWPSALQAECGLLGLGSAALEPL